MDDNEGMWEIDYTYNSDGIRTSIRVDSDGEITEKSFILNGSQIVVETVTSDTYGDYSLTYLYDETGAPVGFKYREPTYAKNVYKAYFFEKNLQGDIIAVYNESGVKIGTYTYDAWGNFTVTVSSGVTTLERAIVEDYNPYHYRGYYFDTETGWYYLQSRYYNPEWGRFVNADAIISGVNGSLQGYNLFVYCFNNPVNAVDSSGNWPEFVKNAVKWVVKNVAKPIIDYIKDVTSLVKFLR